MARYYCGICHLWDDAPGRSIYHCPFCNLCRLGRGLGLDACHCMDCNTCMSLAEYPTHQCRGLAACPVCTDALFESSQPYRVRNVAVRNDSEPCQDALFESSQPYCVRNAAMCIQ